MAEPVLDAAERRARGHRLIIIFVVVFVLAAGLLAWRYATDRALDRQTRAAITEIRAEWQPVDLEQLSDDYSSAVVERDGRFGSLFPRTRESRLFIAEFRAGPRLRAQYVVSASGGERCLLVQVTGPTPNSITVHERDGDC